MLSSEPAKCTDSQSYVRFHTLNHNYHLLELLRVLRSDDSLPKILLAKT